MRRRSPNRREKALRAMIRAVDTGLHVCEGLKKVLATLAELRASEEARNP